jgi:hypothetical protein
MNQDIQKAEQAIWFVISDLNQVVQNMPLEVKPAIAGKAKKLYNKAIELRNEIRVIMDGIGVDYER